MLKAFSIIFIVVIALLSVIILITFKSLNKIILFSTLIINIVSCTYVIFYIQSIGWNIYSLIFIYLNNILLCSFRLIILNSSLNSFIKEKLINIWLIYTKIIYFFPLYIFSSSLHLVILNTYKYLSQNKYL